MIRIATVAATASLVVAGFGLVIALAAGSGGAGAVGAGLDYPQPSAANGCTPVQLHHGSPPAAARSAGIPPALPWVSDRREQITGSLAYLTQPPLRGSQIAVIGTDGRVAGDTATQILWWVRGRGGSTLTITGHRTDSPGSFRQRVAGPAAAGSNTVFPSVVDVPAAGCWTLEVRSGRESVSLRFQAIDLRS